MSARAAREEAERRIREGGVIGIHEDGRIPDILGEPGDKVHSITCWGRSLIPPKESQPIPF